MAQPDRERSLLAERLPGSAVAPSLDAGAVVSLLAAVQELHAAEDLAGGLERVAETLRVRVPYDNLGVLLLDERGHELRFALAVGYAPEVARHWRFGLGQGLVGTVAESGKELLVDDVRADGRYIRAAEPTRTELALPLLVKDRLIGVLDVGSAAPGFFDPERLALLRTVAGQLASAIDSARLYQNLRHQTHTLSLLHELAREFASILDRGELLERVAERLKTLIDYDVFGVMLWNSESGQLEPQLTVYGDGPHVASARPIRLGEGICGAAAALRQTVRVPNVKQDPRFIDCGLGIDVCSELVAPLMIKDRLVGVLDLESARYDAFSAEHEQALSTLAASLSIALENARLYERLQEDERRLQTDLSTAREIQKQLLPKTTPWMPGLQIAFGYRPARHLAGDFYDFLPFGDGLLGVAVGDVSGKATSAALYGSLAVGMLRQYGNRGGLSPAELLADFNCKLRDLGVDNRFLAMVFGVYDGAARRLVLANSGLPHPYVLRGKRVHRLRVEGVPLGLLPDRTYEELTLELEPGDAVVICSDGIEESHNPEDEEFGRDRLERTLERLAGGTAREITDGVLDASHRFAAGADPYDDRSLVVLRAV